MNGFEQLFNVGQQAETGYLAPVMSNYTVGGGAPLTQMQQWGEALGSAWNGLGYQAGQLGSGIANSKPVQGFMNMPGTDQLNALAGGLTAVNGVWNGFNQNKMAKKQFAFQKDVWNQQWGASKQQYNNQLEDRQRARVASNTNPSAYQSVDSYMGKYGMK